MSKPQLLIDTDPGVDDALAILMAHAHADVLGLTTTSGNVGLAQTTANALKLVEVIGADTPVFPGCTAPLLHAAYIDASLIHGRDGFGDTGCTPSLRKPRDEHAVLAMLRITRERPGAVTLVCIGPLTNLAVALKLEPELPQRVARLVIMGGAVTGRGNYERVPTEFNIGFDPEAAAIVFAAFPQFDLVDWEATMRHGVDHALLRHWFGRGDARARFFEAISAHARKANLERAREGMMAADALAMAVALRPEIVTRAETRHVAVETEGRLTRGATVADWGGFGEGVANARIVMEVAPGRFEALMAAALGVPG
ncbi:MAG TPA: nucleoside hydrolase [Rhodanobacteraceae bacterium]|nr:nucleoside hydrolase [Rhodanobacteraceae bacterium]